MVGPFGIFDVLLVLVVAAQASLMGHVREPRHKALILTFPFPFTVAVFAVGRPVEASNVVGLLLLFGFVQAVRLQVQRMGVSIVAAIAMAVAGYVLLSRFLVGVLPAEEWFFWLSCAVVFGVALGGYFRLPVEEEPGHRSPLSLVVKICVLVPLVSGLLFCKQALQGFITVFPILTVFGLYECRHSLSTAGRQIPLVVVSMVAMLGIIRLTQESAGMGMALLLGWIGFLAVLFPFLGLKGLLTATERNRPPGLDGACLHPRKHS